MRISRKYISFTKRAMQSAAGAALAALWLLCAVPARGLTLNEPQHLGMEQGLSTTYVTDIEQDGNGFIWVSSDNGLYRFDGFRFRHIGGNELGLPGNAISTLYYDKRNDKLWIGAKSGISRIDCSSGKVEKVELKDKASIFNVTDIKEAADGGIWIANHYNTIVHLSPDGRETVYSDREIKGLPDSFTSIADDGKGHLILAHNYGGMSVLDTATRKVRTYSHDEGNPNSVPFGTIHSVNIDSHKNVWLTSNHGLTLFIPERETFHTFRHLPGKEGSLAGDMIFTTAEDSKGNVWAGCDMGRVSLFNPSDLTAGSPDDLSFSNFNIGPDGGRGISNGNVRSIMEDSFGNMWICNYGTGLEFISHTSSPFSQLPYFSASTEGFDNRVVWSAFTDFDGTTFLGGTNSVAVSRGGRIVEVAGIPEGLSRPYARVTTIGRSGQDVLIGLYDDGLLRLDRGARSFYRVDTGNRDLGINTIFNDKATGMTLIGSSAGILDYKDGKASVLKGPARILNGISVTGLARDSRNRLWVSTFGNGIFVFDGTFSKALHIGPRQLRSGIVRSLYRDSNGWIWILCPNTIYVAKDMPGGMKIVRMPYASSDNAENFRAVIEDDSGNVWISADTGLRAWLRQSGEFKDFSSGTALPNFNDRAVTRDSSGHIVFGGGSGACVFSPDFIRMERTAGQVRITACSDIGSEQSEPEASGLGIPCGKLNIGQDSSVRIEFSVADFAQSPLVEYSVMLDGLDTDWSRPMRDNYVVYRNLPPGKYTFRVRGRLPNEEWSDAGIASMGINVEPPMWGTWWAKLIYAVLIIGGGLLWVKYYKRRVNQRSQLEVERKKGIDQNELNEERLRFYTNITHELRTPLTLILGPLEDLISDGDTPPRTKEKIRIIHASALRLLNLINQILEFRKTETQNRRLCVSRRNLSEHVMEIALRYKELNRNGKVKYIIDVANDGKEIWFDPDVISTIMNNLLSNAVKYTPEGSVKISMSHEEEGDCRYVCVSVADTGYGIEPEALPHIFDRYYQAKGKHQASGTGIGLALVKSLTDLHGGVLDVESSPGKGTIFTLKLLEDNTYPDALHNDSKENPAEEETTEPEPDMADTRPTVLIVEDNADIREYILGSLGKSFRIIEAENGKEGLQSALENNPDIVVTDLMMPVMDGLELLSKLKGDIRTSHIPVVLLTARDSMQDKEKGYEYGADSYLTKPFSAKLLNSRINNLLSLRRKLASRYVKAAGTAPPSPESAAADSGMGEGDIRISRLDREFLDRFTTLVMENLTNPELDMPFMQENLNMSHSTLYRKVKGLTGFSGKEFIRKLRLRHVVELLTDGYSVSEAAYESGFNDMGYFRSCFKEEYGMSPSSYAKKLKQGEQ